MGKIFSFDPTKNFAFSNVATAPSPPNTGTSFTITTGDGSKFPDPAIDGEFNVVVWPQGQNPDSSNAEICRVIARSGDTFTIQRQQEGTSARQIQVGDNVALVLTSRKEERIKQSILDGYFEDQLKNGQSFTRVDASNFKSPGDKTDYYTKGRRIIIYDGTNLNLFTTESASYSAANDETTITVYGGTLPTTISKVYLEIDVKTFNYRQYLLLQEQPSSPATPSSGIVPVYIDSQDKLLKYLLSSGLIYALETNWGIYRQAIINGNFDIWQRGTSFTGGGYTADRWVFNVAGSGSSTVTRQSFAVGQTDVPNNPTYYISINITTAWTDSNIEQRIEDVRTFAGQKATYSFWAKGTPGNTITVRITQVFGSGGSTSVTVVGGTHTLSSVWQKFTGTIDIPSISGKTLGSDHHLRLTLVTGSQTGTFDIAQVQLNAGEIALPFYPRSVAEELRLCQRYYEKSYNTDVAPGTATIDGQIYFVTVSTGAALDNLIFRVRKRTIPTVTLYSSITGAAGYVSESGTSDVVASAENIGETGFHRINGTFSAGWVNIRFHFTADAEL